MLKRKKAPPTAPAAESNPAAVPWLPALQAALLYRWATFLARESERLADQARHMVDELLAEVPPQRPLSPEERTALRDSLAALLLAYPQRTAVQVKQDADRASAATPALAAAVAERRAPS